MAEYTLRLSFDLRQITQTLAYAFYQSDGASFPLLAEGPLAGTFNFQQGDTIFIEVVATSALQVGSDGATPKDILKDFNVNNCTFVSIPARMTEKLSMFDGGSACETIDGPAAWKPIVRSEGPGNLLKLSRRSANPLIVGSQDGQWKISGYLSVGLMPENGEDFAELYFFDPEGSLGNGGGG